MPYDLEAGVRAIPTQFIHVIKQRYVGPKSCERTEQARAVALVRERLGKDSGIGDVHMPLAPFRWDGWRNLVRTAADDFGPQPGNPGVAIGRIADKGQVVGN